MNLREPTSDTRGFVEAICGVIAAGRRRRTAIDDRDDLIYHRRLCGWTSQQLADVHYLPVKRIERIIMERARMERRA